MKLRPILLGAALGGVLAAPAHAQGCGDSYAVRSGDTMGAIAGRCGTSVEALLKANPSVTDPARIGVGQQLAVPRAADAIAEDWARERDAQAASVLATGRYTVQPGDSMARIATALGVPMATLIGANKGVDPFRLEPGQELALPSATGSAPPRKPVREPKTAAAPGADEAAPGAAAAPGAEPEAAPGAVAPGAQPEAAPGAAAPGAKPEAAPGAAAPGAKPEAAPGAAAPGAQPEAAPGAAAPGAEPEATPGAADGTQTDAAEPADADAKAPDKSAEGEGDPSSASGEVAPGEGAPAADAGEGQVPEPSAEQATGDATSAPGIGPAPSSIPGSGPAPAREPAAAQIVLEGRIGRGTECPTLRTPDGTVYSLVSQHHGFTPGDHVRIEGEPVEMSFCMQGQTVRVTSMQSAPRPQGG